MVLLRAIVTVGGLTMVSRIFGFARDILVAAVLGAGPIADAFFVAFKFPNLFRRLFAEGAFTAAFVPIYAGLVETEGNEKARQFSGEALAVSFWVLFALVMVMELVMPWAMRLFAPGFVDDPEKLAATVLFARITFPYLLFISLVALFAGILNSHGRFATPAATPILLNICLIAALLGATQWLPSAGHALSLGVLVAGVAQLGWLVWHAHRLGIAPPLQWPRLTDRVRLLLKRALPVAVGAGAYQLNLVVDTVIASFLPTGSVSYLFYADRLNQFPLGVIGIAVSTALLPLLSRQIRAGETDSAHDSQNRALEFALLLTLPAAAALIVSATPIVASLFERGAFGAAETAATAAALSAMAVGLPAFMLVKALAPGFFAREDTVTPVVVSVIAMVFNIGLALILMGPFLHVGLAIAMAASGWINAGLLTAILLRRGHLRLDLRLRRRAPRVLAASLVMAGVLVAVETVLQGAFAGTEVQRFLALAALVATGLLAFALVALLLGAVRLRDLSALKRSVPAA